MELYVYLLLNAIYHYIPPPLWAVVRPRTTNCLFFRSLLFGWMHGIYNFLIIINMYLLLLYFVLNVIPLNTLNEKSACILIKFDSNLLNTSAILFFYLFFSLTCVTLKFIIWFDRRKKILFLCLSGGLQWIKFLCVKEMSCFVNFLCPQFLLYLCIRTLIYMYFSLYNMNFDDVRDFQNWLNVQSGYTLLVCLKSRIKFLLPHCVTIFLCHSICILFYVYQS